MQPTTVPTTMRLSVLALFIALPAAVYAAVSPIQRSTDAEFPGDCSGFYGVCNSTVPCCAGLSAHLKSPQAFLPYVLHLLRFTFITELNAGLRKLNKKGDRGKVSLVEFAVMPRPYTFYCNRRANLTHPDQIV